jgi:hypothetical protein
MPFFFWVPFDLYALGFGIDARPVTSGNAVRDASIRT